MKPLKRIPLSSDTNLFAINAIVHMTAFLYLDVTLHSERFGDKEIMLPVRVNHNVSPHERLAGVQYAAYIPVLACHPMSDTEFCTELGYTEVNVKHFSMDYAKCSHWAYMGLLPDVAESDIRDKRYVAPLRVHTVPHERGMPEIYRRNIVHGAAIRTDYLRTSALDNIDDETWAQLRARPDHGTSWSQFLDSITNGRLTPKDNLSECLEDIDQEFMPEHIVKRLRQAQIERRIRG